MTLLRISLNLIHYYQDHRQFSRLFIGDDIKIIRDLEHRIADVFEIENSFHLMCNNFYLPSCEMIQILDDHDLIYVMPNFQPKTKVAAKKKKKNRNTEDLEGSTKTKILKYVHVNSEINNFNGEGDTKRQKSKKDYPNEEVDKKHKKKSKKNADNAEEIFPKPKTKKSKQDLNDKNDSNNETEMEICNNSEKTEENTNQDIEVNENSTATNEIFDNLEAKSRKRRRCITPLKEKRPVTHSKVVSEAFAQEKRLKNIEETDQLETAAIVQSVEIVDQEKQKELNDKLNNVENRQNYSLNDVLQFKSPNTITRSSFKQFRKVCGVGETLKLLSNPESSVNEDSDTTFTSENNFITKRKRCRVRKRKNKKPEDTETETDSPVVFRPPRTVAAPKTHIKFAEEGTENGNFTANGFGETLIHSTPNKQIGNDRARRVNSNLSLTSIDPSKCADLTNVPAVNNIILFKKLKMGESYTPVISNQILAEVQDVLSNGEQLKLKIIDGLDEFQQPTGRFSCILEEDEHDLQTSDNTIIVERSSFIEPKIYRT